MEIKLQDAKYITSSVDQSNWIDDDLVEICFVGKSNVGKSSLINMLLNRKNLARTAAEPGKTRMLNFFGIKVNDLFFRLVDAPGYGFARVSFEFKRQFASVMDEYLKGRKNLKLIVMLVDLRHPPTSEDVQMHDYLSHFQIPTLLIGTKLDKLKKNDIAKNVKVIKSTLRLNPETPFICCSSVNRDGYEECWAELLKTITAPVA